MSSEDISNSSQVQVYEQGKYGEHIPGWNDLEKTDKKRVRKNEPTS